MAISQGGQGQGGLFTEINITPLTDIFLVLLIIMMVIAPMFANANQDIQAPQIQSGDAVDQNAVTVEITKAGGMYVNGTPVTATSLAGELKQWIGKVQDKRVIVRADQSAHSKEVLKVFEAAGQAGFEKMTIAGEPLSPDRQSTLEEAPTEGATAP